jgi:hypothetical protein
MRCSSFCLLDNLACNGHPARYHCSSRFLLSIAPSLPLYYLLRYRRSRGGGRNHRQGDFWFPPMVDFCLCFLLVNAFFLPHPSCLLPRRRWRVPLPRPSCFAAGSAVWCSCPCLPRRLRSSHGRSLTAYSKFLGLYPVRSAP